MMLTEALTFFFFSIPNPFKAKKLPTKLSYPAIRSSSTIALSIIES